MVTICINGVPQGNTYYGMAHALPVAKRMATSRRKKGSTDVVSIRDLATDEEVTL